VTDEILRRAPPDLKRMLDRVREESLTSVFELGAESAGIHEIHYRSLGWQKNTAMW
jgi:hypothetical protein